jgi:NAD(P)-dependent dehydrogenase (short-subunit alcohol dehydrogenase family)
MSPDHSIKTAVVTGANRGIGLEVCRQLAVLGHRVILASRDEARGQAAAAGLGKTPEEVICHPLDVASLESVLRLRDLVAERYGAADVLVNNAAILTDRAGRVLEVPVEKFRENLETNTLGALMLCQAFVPLMLERGYGRVVNVSSDAGQVENMVDDMPAYRLSKIALNGLTLMLADRLRGTNVLVNAAHPGWVRTDMGGPHAAVGLEQGASGIVWLATLPEGGPNGGLFHDGRPMPW